MNTEIHIKDSIAMKLLKMVFSLYLLIAITVTLTHMVAEYYNTEDSVAQDLQVFQKTFEASLSQAVWSFDEAQLQSVLTGMLNVPIITGVKVNVGEESDEIYGAGVIFDQEGKRIALNSEEDLVPVEEQGEFFGIIEHRFPLIFMDEYGNANKMGEGTVYSNTSIVFQKVQYGFLFIVINSVIKTVALWVIFLWVSGPLLSRPWPY